MKESIIKWLIEYDETIVSFITYLVKEYNKPSQIFKILLDICAENNELKENAVKEITRYFIDDTRYSKEISIFWSKSLSEDRDFLKVFETYPKIYGLIVYLELYSKINTPDTMRQYFDFIIYYDLIEATYSVEAIITFTSFITKISENSLLDFIYRYVTEKLCCEIRSSLELSEHSLILILGFFDILKFNELEKYRLLKILSSGPTPLKCRIMNKLYQNYNYNEQEIIKFYYQLLESEDKEILKELVEFWNIATTEVYASYIFNALIDKVYIEDTIYGLLENIATSYKINFDKKKFIKLKNDHKLVIHLYMFTIEILPDIFSIYIDNDFDDLILKLIDLRFSNLLPYIGDILKKCLKNFNKSLKIIVKILENFDNKDIAYIPLEVWNMYVKLYHDEFNSCRYKIKKFLETEIEDLPFRDKILSLQILRNFQSSERVDKVLQHLENTNDEYEKFKLTLELETHKN